MRGRKDTPAVTQGQVSASEAAAAAAAAKFAASIGADPSPTGASSRRTTRSFAVVQPPGPMTLSDTLALNLDNAGIDAASLPRQEFQRQAAILELVLTEAAYLEDLRTMMTGYMPAMVAAGVLTVQTKAGVFANLVELFRVSQDFLAKLQAVQAQAPLVAEIGPMLTEWAPAVRTFSGYVNNYSKARAAVTALREGSPAMATLEAERGGPGQLDGLLIKPVQRCCKYPLLVREIWRHTDEAAPDAAALQTAFDAVSESLDVVNEQKRELETMEESLTLVRSITAAPLDLELEKWVLAKRLVKFGPLLKVARASGSKEERVFLLFDHLLLWAKGGSKRLTYKKHVLLGELDVVVDAAADSVTLSFGGSDYALVFESADERQNWGSVLTQSVEAVRARASESREHAKSRHEAMRMSLGGLKGANSSAGRTMTLGRQVKRDKNWRSRGRVATAEDAGDGSGSS